MKGLENSSLSPDALKDAFLELKERLEKSRQTYEALFHHFDEGVILISPQGEIRLINTALEMLLKIKASELIGKPSSILPPHLFGFSVEEALLKQRGEWQAIVSLNLQEEAQKLIVSAKIIPLEGLMITLRKQEEKDPLEESVQRDERLMALGEMAAQLAHEIRNPLGGIEGFANLLKREIELPEQQEMLSAILDGTKTLNHLVTNVLDYARPLKVNLTPCDLTALCKSVQTLLKGENKQFELITSEPSYIVSVDEMRFKLALLNILRNSFESGAKRVSLKVKKRIITIEDNGPGIAKEHLKRIFTPFFTTKTTGTGLGLAEVQKVIQAHGAEIDISSIYQKQTRVTIYLKES